MKYIKKSLLITGWMLILAGVIGTAGASDMGKIDGGQALLKLTIFLGLGLTACFAGRWCCVASRRNTKRERKLY